MYVADSELDITYCQEMPGEVLFSNAVFPLLAGVDCGPICTAGHHHFSVCVCVLFG